MKIVHTDLFITLQEFVFGIALTYTEDFFSIQILCFVLAFFFGTNDIEREDKE